MAHINYQGFPPHASLADEPSKLISDPRIQNAILSVRLADGILVQVKPQRQQCDKCKSFSVEDKLLAEHKAICHIICKLHKLAEIVPLGRDWRDEAKRKALDNAVDPTYTHTCCFVVWYNSAERVPSGWNNLEITEHVIREHTHGCLDDMERQQLLQGFRRTQRRLV
jgi:hypothetical protein